MRTVETDRGKKIQRAKREIINLKRRCRVNFAGFWDLDHSSYTGDLDDLPTTTVRRWFEILGVVNSTIADKKKQS